MTTKNAKNLNELLLSLGLRGIVNALDDILALAAKHRWSATQVFEHACQLELDERTRRSLERRLRRSNIGRFKPLADFDWDWPTSIDRKKIDAAMRLDFLASARNIVFVAAQGLGKTMIAQNVAHAAALAGHTVRFVNTSDLLLDLAAQDSARSLDRRLRYWSAIPLLVLDELGYLSYDSRNADLLFQVVSRRYEKKSLILTTNLAFKDWPTVFPNSACTTALIDRIVHHADVVRIKGKSYRLREAQDEEPQHPSRRDKPRRSR